MRRAREALATCVLRRGGYFAATAMVVVQHLLPQKARILLMLALTRTKDPREVQRIFDEY